MNQSIQVIDGYCYCDANNALKIQVMVAGQLLNCFVTGAKQAELTLLYKAKQFEIEEIIENKVAAEQISEKGEIWLTFDEVCSF